MVRIENKDIEDMTGKPYEEVEEKFSESESLPEFLMRNNSSANKLEFLNASFSHIPTDRGSELQTIDISSFKIFKNKGEGSK